MTTIVPPTVPKQVVDPLEHLDFQPPCEYAYWHEPPCGRPATLAVWSKSCCGEHPTFRYFCDDCWQLRNSAGYVECTRCHRQRPSMQDVLRVERL